MAQKILYDCKVCGGNLVEKSPGMAKCESCRREQSIPLTANAEMINRANRLRMHNKNFPEAMALYMRVLEETPDEAEANWGVVLCRYGIEFVEDKRTGTYIPTCHRTIECSIKDDVNFIDACEKANDEVRQYYLEQAEIIDGVQKRIHAIVQKEKPYDIFISYKANDDLTKSPTPDSKEALKIYHKLDNKGFKVFFAEETLKQHAGEEYEAIIYAALKTSKVMILIGSKSEYFEATWVKNEWTRFMDMMNDDPNKKLLPFYFDMDAYDLPVELSGAEALNWRDAEAMSQLIENVEKILGFSSDKKASVNSMDVKAAIVSREQDKAIKKLNNAIVLAKSNNKTEAKRLLDEIIKDHPDFAAAYWQRLLFNLNVNDKTIVQQQFDLRKHSDYIQAISNAVGDQKKYYQEVERKCSANRALQSEYQDRFLNIKQQYREFNNNPKIAELDSTISQYLEHKIFSPVYFKNEAIVLTILLAIAGLWLVFTGGALTEVAPEYEGTVTMFLVIGAIVIFIFMWIATSSLVGGAIIAGIIVLAVIMLVLAAGAGFFYLTVILAVIFAIILGFKIFKISKNKKGIKEYDGVFEQLKTALEDWKQEFNSVHQSLLEEYMDKAYKADTFIDRQDASDIGEKIDKYIMEKEENKNNQILGVNDENNAKNKKNKKEKNTTNN